MSDSYDDDPLSHAAPAAAGPASGFPAAGYPAAAQRFAYLDGLNPTQRAAVEALDGPVLVLAGAGTGKTRVLTTRLAHLLMTRRAAAFQILAVTFTNKAAREMRERVAHLVGIEPEGWWLGTFHALAARILRRHAELVGLKSNFTILDTDDQVRLIKQLLEAENIDSKKWPARQVLGAIERWKDRGLTPDRLGDADGGEVAGGRVVAIYRAYQERLRTLNACDFGDLLLHNLAIFQNNPDVLAEYHRKFKYVLVDEYQDTNVAQYLWLRILSQAHKNICCVGDEDQSIYAWRGAEIGNILRFETDFPGATIIKLEQNYRSTGHILAAASGLIANNQGRLGKTLWTEADGGEPVKVKAVWDGEEEARWVGEEIETLQRKGTSLAQIAVLVRAGFQTREFEERFITLGLPYKVLGGPRFYERQEIRDALAYFRVVNSGDDDLAFERVVNLPKRGVGPAAMQSLYTAARARGLSLTEAGWVLTETDELKPKLRATLRGLLQDFFRWRTLMATVPHTELARTILDESGYTRMWQEDKTPEAPGRLENLKELITAMAEFENLPGFLEHVALVMENAEAAGIEQVTVMTLHGAKGLEFDHVFLPGWEEGVFPNQRALDETGIAGLEEERRLAYVGLTRARRRAYVSHAANRRLYGNWVSAVPSRFVEEIPQDNVEAEAANGLFAGSGGRGNFGGGAGGYGGAGGFQFRGSTRQAPAPKTITLDQSAYAVAPRPRPDAPFAKGARVFHQKFGYGTVAGVSEDKLEIDFDHSGSKKVMDSFVVPADKAG
ncbi:DNA helicase-2/ATP-dependent DNA helicase PcrA [Azospirillum lipoferum]|uniref:DNA 3'-5' helicase n=1 Tax=Azospirillum lipoferum TaxID=193 RepID=A0A5A9GX96_AZOLI|nr:MULTISPECIES: UvrD-helicase domain-containing protein [Azospirillum]KAA0598422.1 AAA family ATPase [Azospirillum lipoferum]MCP1609583.1 DNA helicase-2/ATP-dependent DNA helicase PcrA [Azospirillum lipoferum]MDW5535108.1 UvrD-helicase domain-containing protein [Azospirillum sp. NL1]